VARLLLEYGLENRTLICGHDARALRQTRGIYPFPLGWSFPQSRGSSKQIIIPHFLAAQELKESLKRFIEAGGASWCQGLMLRWDALDQKVIDLLHDRGQWVAAWTVDDAAVAQDLLAMGVDNITSNFPFDVIGSASVK
jgi:glycerophosphoryl diester phosphodiesterase